MALFKNYFVYRSLRKQILTMASLLATVVLLYTWWTGSWVASTGRSSTDNIEQRIRAADLSHKIRRSVVEANNQLDIFLLTPSDGPRDGFHRQINRARSLLKSLLDTRWIADSHMLSIPNSRHTYMATPPDPTSASTPANATLR